MENTERNNRSKDLGVDEDNIKMSLTEMELEGMDEIRGAEATDPHVLQAWLWSAPTRWESSGHYSLMKTYISSAMQI